MLTAAIFAISLLGQEAQADPTVEPPFDAQLRITEALAAVRPIAYNRGTADWPAIEARARRLATEATDTTELLPAYAAITFGLRDKHSFVQATPAMEATWRARHGNRRVLPDEPEAPRASSTFIGRKDITIRPIALSSGRTAHAVVVPAVDWLEGSTSAPYGNTLYDAVASVSEITCGYILDNRGNTGGDVWPMVSGLSDLIGDGHVFGSVNVEGVLKESAYLKDGGAISTDPNEDGGPLLNRVAGWRARPAQATIPVAVLQDDGTASSGEGVVIAFRGRPNTRFFGETTYGVAGGNELIRLKDGVRLFISVSFMPDRSGTVYPLGIPPDQQVTAGEGDPADPDDAATEAAKAWLATQAGCAG